MYRHGRLLAEGGAEEEFVAHPRQFGGLAAHDLGDARLSGQRRRHFDRAGVAGPEQHVGVGIQRFLHLRARDARIGLRVRVRDDDFVAENAARRIDLLNGEIDAVLPVGADGRAAAGKLGDIGEQNVLR